MSVNVAAAHRECECECECGCECGCSPCTVSVNVAVNVAAHRECEFLELLRKKQWHHQLGPPQPLQQGPEVRLGARKLAIPQVHGRGAEAERGGQLGGSWAAVTRQLN